MRFWKRMTIIALCLGLLAGGIPLLSYAEEEISCTHHPLHTPECGYREAAEEIPCGHSHDEACGYAGAVDEIPCTCQAEPAHGENCAYTPAVEGQSCDCAPAEEGGEVVHAEGCGFVAAVEGIPCTCTPVTDHEENCGYTPARAEIVCAHQHDEACGYKAAVEAAECTFSCETCKSGIALIDERSTPEGFYVVVGADNVIPAGQRLELPPVGSTISATFYLGNTKIAPSSLTAGGVVQLTAGMNDSCILQALGEGMGSITYVENDNYHVLEVGRPISVEQELVFWDPGANNYNAQLVVPQGQTRTFQFYRTPQGAGQFTQVTSGMTCGGVAKATANSDGTYTIEALGEGYGYLYHMDENGLVASMRFRTSESGGGNEGPGPNHQQFTVTYGGKNITIGLGEMFEGALHMFQPGVVGDYYAPGAQWPFQRQIVLGAMEAQNNGNNTVALAPKEFYDCISNVKVEIVSCQNADGSTNGSNCFLVDDPTIEFTPTMQLQATKKTIQSVDMHQFFVMADPGNCFEADLKVTFDLTLDGETKSYTIDSQAGYWEVPVFEITVPGNAEELNGIFASYANLEAYLQGCLSEQDYNAFRQLSTMGPGPDNPMLYVHLPEASYDDPISYNVQIPEGVYLGNIELYGAGAGKTTLPGLEINGKLTQVWNMSFVSNGEMNSGIHVTDNGTLVEQVINCSFTDFDYGIRNYGKKYVSCARYCTFNRCENGIYMDCTGEEDAWGLFTDGDNHNNTFQNCRYAVRLVNLPAQLTSYQYRMYDSIFRNNHKDFHITTRGNKHYYYFHRNYYDGVYSEAASVMALSGEESFRAAAIETDASTTAVVVTNPCRTSSARNSPLWVFGGEGQHTRIFNSEADQMAVSGDAFAAGENKEIIIVSDKEEELATWIFGE